MRQRFRMPFQRFLRAFNVGCVVMNGTDACWRRQVEAFWTWRKNIFGRLPLKQAIPELSGAADRIHDMTWRGPPARRRPTERFNVS